MDVRPADFYREICRVSPLLGAHPITYRHFQRIYSGGSAATTTTVLLLIVAAARGLTRLPVRVSELFDLEPAFGSLTDELLLGHPDPTRGDTAPLSVFWRPRSLREGSANIMSQDDLPLTAPEVLAALYHEHGPIMMAHARVHWKVPRRDAEEILHEVFLSFLERQPQVVNIGAFLIGATRNACKYYWRKRDRARERETELRDDYADAGENRRQARWPLVTTLVVALAQMGPRCRETLQSYYNGDETLEEIAARLKVTPGYVHQILHACREELRHIVRDRARKIA